MRDIEIFDRELLSVIRTDWLDPDAVPIGVPNVGFWKPHSGWLLPVARLAQIPEVNTEAFLGQVERWVIQFRLMSRLDGDRRQFKAAVNAIKTTTKQLLSHFDYLDKFQYGPFMLNKQLSSRLIHECKAIDEHAEPSLVDVLQDLHREKIAGPVTTAVFNTLKDKSDLVAIGQAFDTAVSKAMESEAAQLAGLRLQLKVLRDATEFLSSARVPKKPKNRTKQFMKGVLRIVKTNGGSLPINKNVGTGRLADVYKFFGEKMPPGSWDKLSSSTLYRLTIDH